MCKQSGVRALLLKVQGDVEKFTKRVSKEGLQSLLKTKFQVAADKVSVTDFVKTIKRERKTIFHRDDVNPDE